MKRPSFPILVLFLAALGGADPSAAGGAPRVGEAGPDLLLPLGPGEGTRLSAILAAPGVKAVVIDVTSTTCPYSRRADGKLPGLVRKAKGALFLSVYPGAGETAEGLAAYGKQAGLEHRLRIDPGGRLARALGAEVTPTFYLFDTSGILRYRGNLAGLSPVLEAVLGGDAVLTGRTIPAGCTIRWRAPEGGGRKPGKPESASPGRPKPGAPPPGAAAAGGVPPLSDEALAWLGKLLSSLGSGDELVRRSAEAAILALGRGALPHLRKARETARGPARARLGDLVRRLERMGRGPFGSPRRIDRRGRDFFDVQREFIERRLTLTEDQKKALEEAMARLKKREADARRLMESGERKAARAAFEDLRRQLRKELESILTEEQLRELDRIRRRMGPRVRPGRDR